MVRCNRVYYLYEDGSINLNPTVIGRCQQVMAYNKKEAESLQVFIHPHQVFAEIRNKKNRALYVDKAVLDAVGLHQHLHLGRRDGYRVEVLGSDPREVVNAIHSYLLNCIYMMVPTTLAATGKLADTIYAQAASVFDAGGVTAPTIIRCSAIPTHVTTEMHLYTDAEVLNKVAPAAEGVANEDRGPVDLRDSMVMRAISVEALAEANRLMGSKPGSPEHIRLQKKLRNKIAQDRGFEKFNGERMSYAQLMQRNMALEKLHGPRLAEATTGQGE